MLLSLTLEHRLRQLISQMCLLARHRTSPLPPHPTRLLSTSTPTLLDLARAERRKEEIFQSRKRARIADKEGPPEKRVAPSSIKNNPASSRARGRGISTEMTSEAQKRSTDTTVKVMLGGGRKNRYSWMAQGGGGSSSSDRNRRRGKGGRCDSSCRQSYLDQGRNRYGQGLEVYAVQE